MLSSKLECSPDGERRYSKLLFDICHETLKTGKRGRPRRVLPKGLSVRLKNKSSKRRDAEGKLDKVSCYISKSRIIKIVKKRRVKQCQQKTF